ncbi:hypothetical protein CDAR_614801 [Caerostris darwini]|uniref:Uncharacterized protein n=1 Tax=Caerostris darwini TaxID=1538125 RepID=A0AAV4U4S3_9ARAC|nr:hypothetical protein CDAR_614801 [Caerostris darwini]
MDEYSYLSKETCGHCDNFNGELGQKSPPPPSQRCPADPDLRRVMYDATTFAPGTHDLDPVVSPLTFTVKDESKVRNSPENVDLHFLQQNVFAPPHPTNSDLLEDSLKF